jgi:L-amino acid N-acyltransferase YncA
MIVRDAVETDLPAIVGIYNSTIPERMATADTVPVSIESRVPWFRAHDPDRRPIWVAEVDGAIAAWLSLQSFYGRPAYVRTAELSVYVSERDRRRGLARRLVGDAIRRGPELGLATLLGFVFAHNEPSVRLFEGLGFRRWGHLPRVAELDGVERDLLVLGRRLDGAEV